MFRSLRNRLLAHIIETHPALYLRLKGVRQHRMCNDPAFLRVNARLVREGDGLQQLSERYNLWSLARTATTRPGAFAELGVYRGGSALILCEAKGAAPLHLFDTFGGMPAVNPATDGAFREGDFADGTLGLVQTRLAGYAGVTWHPGVFPATAASLAPADARFQFVHLDVDLYQSTHDGLNFFYPRLAVGGFLVSHDYNDPTVPGVKRGFDEFMRDKPERLVELWQTQVLLTKL